MTATHNRRGFGWPASLLLAAAGTVVSCCVIAWAVRVVLNVH